MLGNKEDIDIKNIDEDIENDDLDKKELTEDELKFIYDKAIENENPQNIYELIVKYSKISNIKSSIFIFSSIKLCNIYLHNNNYYQFKYILLVTFQLFSNNRNYLIQTTKQLINNIIKISIFKYSNRDYIEYIKDYFKKIKQDETSSFIEDCLNKCKITNFDIIEVSKNIIKINPNIKKENYKENNPKEINIIDSKIQYENIQFFFLFQIGNNLLCSSSSLIKDNLILYCFLVLNLDCKILFLIKSINNKPFSQIFQYLPNKFVLTCENNILFYSLIENTEINKDNFKLDKYFNENDIKDIKKCINIEKINSEKIAFCFSNNKILIFSGICNGNIILTHIIEKNYLIMSMRIKYSTFAIFSSYKNELKIELIDHFYYNKKSDFIFNNITNFNINVFKINKTIIGILSNNIITLFDIKDNNILYNFDLDINVKKITYNIDINQFIFKTDSNIFICNFNESIINFEKIIKINIEKNTNNEFIILNSSFYYIINNKLIKSKLKYNKKNNG